MPPVPIDGKRPDPAHSGEGQDSIQMREEVAAAGHLVAQGCSQRIGFDGDEQEVALLAKMLRRRLPNLGRRGDVAVLQVDRRPGEDPGALRLIPQLFGADFVDETYHDDSELCGGGLENSQPGGQDTGKSLAKSLTAGNRLPFIAGSFIPTSRPMFPEGPRRRRPF
jgi:hypothetical protein